MEETLTFDLLGLFLLCDAYTDLTAIITGLRLSRVQVFAY